MKIDGGIGYDHEFSDAVSVCALFKEFEECGYDGVNVSELAHDPFLALALGASVTSTVELRSSVGVAFARNPVSMAHIGHDLNAYSHGRFTLGLGSQVKTHIERRFGCAWGAPIDQMSEYIDCLHAVWDCWYNDKPLHFEGKYYRHTLMTPDFSPGNSRYGRPRVALAAVGQQMVNLAAAKTDGLILHAFISEKYLSERVLPAVYDGLQLSGKTRNEIEISISPFIVSGCCEEEIEKERAFVRSRIAFYASTPAYVDVLQCHGYEDIHEPLNKLSKAGRWAEMAGLVSDEMLATYSISAPPEKVVSILRERYQGIADRVSIATPYMRAA